MRKQLVLLLIFVSSLLNAQNMESKGESILIYTRNGEGYVHDNIAASVQALEEICKVLGIKTEHTDNPEIFDSGKLNTFDAIVFSNSNNEAFLTQEQRDNFQKFIRSGKGFMAIHSANASERECDWYASLVGGRFVRHPLLQSFDINVIDKEHISTKHLPGIWSWEDECYYSDHLNPAIHILLAADLTTVEDAEKASYPGTVFGNLFPLAWCHEFEGSRVFFTALGHKIEYYKDENFRKHLEGGIVWIMGEAQGTRRKARGL
jgi:type 1 glutamine amidotransferase